MAQLYSSLPDGPGVYLFKDEKDQILYVGKARNLRDRVSSYLGKRTQTDPKTNVLVGQIAGVEHIVVTSELEALLLEANLIKKYKPPYNVRWADGKAYPFIKITVRDSFPAVLQSRKIDDPGALYFGPYPNIGNVRWILRWVRKVFPYQSVKNHPKRRCLYFHLGLCPCPPLLSESQLSSYRRSIRYLVAFLEGKRQRVVALLEKEMRLAASNEDFEEAERVKHKLDTIHLITSLIHHPQEYIENPGLVEEEAMLDITSLQDILSTPKMLSRIECYDISNIQGKQATGSMVVATNGQIDKSQYRRFKIRLQDTLDDIAMMREMLARRLKHGEWSMPDLVVVDGGINQVNVAGAVVEKSGLTIPVIGLAKRLEEIIIPTPQGQALRGKSYMVIRLSRNHRALKLLQRLRDEAHRFALSYHRKLRLRKLLS